MPTPTDPKREHPSAYFVQDRTSQDERIRVMIQDKMLTKGMGGVLPEQPDPTVFQRVLDVGCGTGGWLIELAQTYPTIPQLFGVDVSSTMVAYARAEAEAQQVSNRVTFYVGDALRALDFPSNFFDLINQRLGMSYLRTWEWPNLLHECRRVARSKGVIRLTETKMNGPKTSSALTRLGTLFRDVSYHAGHLFTPEDDGVTSQLSSLLQRQSLLHIQTREHVLHYQAGTPEMQLFSEDMARLYRNALPFMRKWTRVPDDYEETYQQALVEMQQADFSADWPLLTAWGTVPPKLYAESFIHDRR
jgi:ubiquinone/menaquinone biosynthesis C-methylase UbiE